MMKTKRLAVSCGHFAWSSPRATFSGGSPYTLGPNDKIHIQVYDNDDLTQDVTIP